MAPTVVSEAATTGNFISSTAVRMTSISNYLRTSKNLWMISKITFELSISIPKDKANADRVIMLSPNPEAYKNTITPEIEKITERKTINDIKRRLGKVVIEIENPEHKIKPGMFGSVRIRVKFIIISCLFQGGQLLCVMINQL